LPSESCWANAVVASSPSQSPKDEKTIEFQSLRKGLIAKTPRVTSCAGAAGVGSVLGMVRVYRGEPTCSESLKAAALTRLTPIMRLLVTHYLNTGVVQCNSTIHGLKEEVLEWLLSGYGS